jgi:hypothetical protein
MRSSTAHCGRARCWMALYTISSERQFFERLTMT